MTKIQLYTLINQTSREILARHKAMDDLLEKMGEKEKRILGIEDGIFSSEEEDILWRLSDISALSFIE